MDDKLMCTPNLPLLYLKIIGGKDWALLVLTNQLRKNICFQIVEEEKFGESTWTIDLAYLLNRYLPKFYQRCLSKPRMWLYVRPSFSRAPYFHFIGCSTVECVQVHDLNP